jgi:hypothetical protein
MFVLSAVVSRTFIALCQLAPGDHFDIAQGSSALLLAARSLLAVRRRSGVVTGIVSPRAAAHAVNT